MPSFNDYKNHSSVKTESKIDPSGGRKKLLIQAIKPRPTVCLAAKLLETHFPPGRVAKQISLQIRPTTETVPARRESTPTAGFALCIQVGLEVEKARRDGGRKVE